jgi:hypothetical protein
MKQTFLKFTVYGTYMLPNTPKNHEVVTRLIEEAKRIDHVYDKSYHNRFHHYEPSDLSASMVEMDTSMIYPCADDAKAARDEHDRLKAAAEAEANVIPLIEGHVEEAKDPAF